MQEDNPIEESLMKTNRFNEDTNMHIRSFNVNLLWTDEFYHALLEEINNSQIDGMGMD